MRAAVLQGQPPSNRHAAQLQQGTNVLRTVGNICTTLSCVANGPQELAGITDQRVAMMLQQSDMQAGKWTVEDPPTQVLMRLAAASNTNTGGRS